MKKMFLILVLVASAITQTVSAADEKVSPRLSQALVKEFSGAQAIHWQAFKGKDIYQASFILNNQRLFAFFNGDGELLSTGRYVAETNLPILVSRAIAARFADFELKEVVEYTRDGDTQYALVLENGKKTILANAYTDGGIAVIQKKKK
jgi:hypothetical protein